MSEELLSVKRICEELQQSFNAALHLASMIYKESSPEPATLDVQESKTEPQKESNIPTEEERLIPQTWPPDIPRVPSLNGLIGKYTQPFEKQLTDTDVNYKQCRLSIGKLDVENAVTPLLKEDEDIEKGIPVKVYDENGKEYSMKFVLWSHKLHVLKEGWVEFSNHHGLLARQDFVRLWVFRKLETDELCFLITSKREEVFERIKKKRKMKASTLKY